MPWEWQLDKLETWHPGAGHLLHGLQGNIHLNLAGHAVTQPSMQLSLVHNCPQAGQFQPGAGAEQPPHFETVTWTLMISPSSALLSWCQPKQSKLSVDTTVWQARPAPWEASPSYAWLCGVSPCGGHEEGHVLWGELHIAQTATTSSCVDRPWCHVLGTSCSGAAW